MPRLSGHLVVTRVQGPCEHAYSAKCINRYLKEKPVPPQCKCPVRNKDINFATLQKIPRVLQNLICEAKVRCGSCGTAIELKRLKSYEMVCKGKENEPLDGNGLVLRTTSW